MCRLVEIAGCGAKISLRNGQLRISTDGREDHTLALIDCDAVVVSDSHYALTGEVLAALAKYHIPLICCDSRHLPIGIYRPVSGGGSREEDQMLELQSKLSLTRKKQLWQKLIQRKVYFQGAFLKNFYQSTALLNWHQKVRSGDKSNIEAQAAAIYWSSLHWFRQRDRRGSDINILLNYVYMVLYAVMAQAICAGGLHPHLGIFHHNQYNTFCLASDLMEPYRVWGDLAVAKNRACFQETTGLTVELRKNLLAELYRTQIKFSGKNYQLFTAMRETVWSYKRCLRHNDPTFLRLPDMEMSNVDISQL